MADGNFPTYVTEATTVIWTATASATVRPAGSFVNFTGTGTVGTVGFLGVSTQDLPANVTNVPIAVDIEGIVQTTAFGACGVGQPLTGQVGGAFGVSTVGQEIHGRAMSDATAAGQRILMKITREGKL